MYNEIYLKDGRKLVTKEKQGRAVKWIFNDDSSLSGIDMRLERIDIKCHKCSELKDVRFYLGLLDKKYLCQSCNKKGERNPFYNKQHTEETKKKLSDLMSGRFVGELNHFYNKTHTIEVKQALSQKAKEWQKIHGNQFKDKHHTEETKKVLSQKSTAYALAHPEEISQRAIKALEKKKYKKTFPEQMVEEQLQEMELEYKYNKILKDIGQFDFIIGDVLLEVNGDYWHANPLIYGSGKKQLNERQEYKVRRDIVKKEQAEKLGYRVLYIWEYDIKQGNFEVLNEI